MATPSAINPLSHLINREINNKLNIKVKLYNCRLEAATSLYKKDLISHYGCVNAIEFSDDGELLVSGGDDRRVLLWKVHSALMGPATYKPYAMKQRHFSNIFCLSFDSRKHRIYSGGNDDQVIVHDAETGVARDVFLHDRPVYGLSVDPNNDFIFCSAGDDGRVLVYDSRADASGDSICIAKYHYPFHAVTYHPTESGLIATANAKEGAALWDIRKPRRPLLRYGEDSSQTCMSIRFNSLGTKLLALRRRLPPVLFSVNRSEPEVTFYHTDYYNSCTMKSCCFAGRQDQFVMSGSDDFNLYMWRIPPNDGPGKDLAQSSTKRVYKTHMVLYGHRSIVNQVRYNQNNCFVASSGVEKMIKLWSPFKMPEWSGGLTEEAAGNENPRNPYTNEDYNLMMQVGGQFNLHHDYSSQSTSEDPTMMAFFDTLIQQDSETWRTGAAGDSTACTSSTSSTSNTDSSSMAHDSTDTEASEVRAANCKVKWSKRNHLTVSPLVSRPQRAEYPNRIDFLLAMKRSQLMRLAQKKRAAHCARRQRNRQHGQDTRRRVSRTSRSGIGRQAVREREKNRILNNRPTRRSTRNSSCRYRHRVAADIKKRSRKQLKSSNSTPVMVPANLSEPSTSTGITGTGSKIMFRIAHEPDSEDDGSGISCNKSPISPLRIRLVNILPTPINGSRSQCPPIDSPNSEHDQDCPNTSRENDNISTTSAGSQDSRLSPKDDFKDHLSGFTSHLRVQTPDSGILTGPCSSAGSMSSEIVPIQNAIKVNSHNDLVAEPSTSTGIGTGAKAFFNVRNFFKREHTDPNSDESSWSDYQTIKRKIKKVRRNYRHHFESDSS